MATTTPTPTASRRRRSRRRGHFSIQYKQTGWQKSKLGELYYPSYFTNTGYAIHGEGNGNGGGEVPPYPNSHGCVRITNNAVLRYYNKSDRRYVGLDLPLSRDRG